MWADFFNLSIDINEPIRFASRLMADLRSVCLKAFLNLQTNLENIDDQTNFATCFWKDCGVRGTRFDDCNISSILEQIRLRRSSTSSNNGARVSERFPLGSATASYQVEGAVKEDGRGPSIWDTFSHTPGKVVENATGDVADDHYHRYKEDVQLMKSLGVKSLSLLYRLATCVSKGDGAPNPKGLDFYNRLVDELLANGIQPFATLYHWDLPQALQDNGGGWESRDTSKAFGDYAGYVAERLSDRVKHFFTINEFGAFVELGYRIGYSCAGSEVTTRPVQSNTTSRRVGPWSGCPGDSGQGKAGNEDRPGGEYDDCGACHRERTAH